MDKKIKPIASGVLAVVLVLGYLFYNAGNVNEKNDVTTNSNFDVEETLELHFRNDKLLNEHYEKHGKNMGFASAGDYEAAAARVVADEASLHKIEAEDGDDVYFLEATNEFVIVSTDGYIRTYFIPQDGIEYFNRQ